jgi:hypothetical protein
MIRRIIYKPVFALVLIFLFSGISNAQLHSDSVKYTPDFKFKDGIYLNFDMVRENNPIPKAKLLTSVDYNDREFFSQLMKGDKIYFYDNMGMRQELDKSSIWGFARNGVIYRKVQDNYYRITYFGSIIHYVADITTYDQNNYYSGYPYGGYYNPYYSSYYNPYYSSPYSYGGYPNSSSSRTNLYQFIIDFETGDEREYNLQSLEVILMRDPELYSEFQSMRGKNKKKMMFVFLRRYNEKHPVFIPENK